MNSCCKDCEDKKEGCHDRCPKYIGEILANFEEKDKELKGRQERKISESVQIDSVKRWHKRMKGKRK